MPAAYAVRASGTLAGVAIAVGGFVTGATDVIVDGNSADVSVVLQRVPVSGGLDLDTLKAEVELRRLRSTFLRFPISADWEFPLMSAHPDAAGKFTMRGVAPGRYRVGVRGLPDGWVLASAVFNDKDAADYNLVVESKGTYSGGVLKFSTRTSEVAGVVANASGQPVTEYVVLLFPAERNLWVPQSRRIHVAQPAADGRYVIRGLPPGDYRLAAVGGVEPGQQFDMEFLSQSLIVSVPLSIGEGERRTQDLRVK